MKDYLRESLSYFGIYSKMFKAGKSIQPEKVSYGGHSRQHFLYYRPEKAVSDKIIVWVHGGGWNAGSPGYFDFVGQRVAGAGYHFVSVGYRLSPKHRYPSQIEDVCRGYSRAVAFLAAKGLDVSKIIVSGPSAGAHLTSIMCYSRQTQRRYGVNPQGIIGFIGFGGPYSFKSGQSLTVKLLLDMLFEKGSDKKQGEPVYLMEKSDIPGLIIQSRHDGLIDFSCRQDFCRKGARLGNSLELYEVEDKKNTHSWYTAGCFLQTREESKTLDKFFSWIEER